MTIHTETVRNRHHASIAGCALVPDRPAPAAPAVLTLVTGER